MKSIFLKKIRYQLTSRKARKLIGNPRVVFGFLCLGIVAFCAVFANVIAPFSPDDADLSRRLLAPSYPHLLGCDLNGRDVLTSMLFGARISLYVAFMTVILAVSTGTVIGIISGYFGGWLDTVFMRLVDVFMAIPGILVALVLSAFLGAGVNNVILAISATGWTSAARLVRGQVLSLRERDYVLASRALGAPHGWIMFKHIFPGVLTPLAVHASFSLSGVILLEASLSFLGLGVQSETPTWGALLGQGRNVLSDAPFLSIVPGIAIMILVLGLNFLGDGMRDVLDPKN